MPKLSSLWIGACEELEMIPDGLRYVTTLKEVSLVQMPEGFNNRIRGVNGQQGEDYDKIRKVASVKILRYSLSPFTFFSSNFSLFNIQFTVLGIPFSLASNSNLNFDKLHQHHSIFSFVFLMTIVFFF